MQSGQTQTLNREVGSSCCVCTRMGGGLDNSFVLPLLNWLIQGAVGPALFGLPVTWTATDLSEKARGWFRRLRRSDGLSRIVRAAADGLGLSDDEFSEVRRLLEKESTWVEVGHGEVEDLAVLIASCLSCRPGEGSLAAGRAIAAGLLEFAVRDLEPEWFRQVLFARLDRLEASQQNALDGAMLGIHADLAALLAHQDAVDEDRFALVMVRIGRALDQLRALDRLAPGPAGQAEVAVYLATLVRWLNTDPWPQDTRFAGPALTSSAIERKLRITDSSEQGGQSFDADELAGRCARLVVLGGPGSGKTWLAKRAARLSAEAALKALAAGAQANEVELPLYTTCARLAAAPPGDDIRRAVVASAFSQLPDLGGARVASSMRALFEERDAPTLLVADSLDEARGADDRIRLVDTLPAAWRIVVTSRPASWSRQLAVDGGDPSRQVGILQPIRYPDDVEPFIARWFSERPTWGADLTAQLRARPALQHAATVPLILAFYCIVGGDQPLPVGRADLYAKVIRRMLTGLWRGGGRDPDPGVCVEILRDWAWSTTNSDPETGVGFWVDEFSTPRVRQSRDDREALDHVAPPLGPPDPDTGLTKRRFVHRSFQEHLVAEHIALRTPADEAARELLNHLWYDPDWEYAAPAALSMHPGRNQILKELICRVTRGDQLPADLTAIDGCWEFRSFLARVAQESGEGDWSPEGAEMIGQARLDIATSRLNDLRLVVAGEWPTSNGPIFESLLGRLRAETNTWRVLELADALNRLATSAEDLAQARQALLGLLAGETDPRRAGRLANALIRLEPSATDLAQARQAILSLLAGETDPSRSRKLAEATRMAPSAKQRAAARQRLLIALGGTTDPWGAGDLAEALTRLEPSAEDLARARRALSTKLAKVSDPRRAGKLADVLSLLEPCADEQAQARQALLSLLTRETDPLRAGELADVLTRLAPCAQDLAQARQALLTLIAGTKHYWRARKLPDVITRLEPSAEDLTQARQAIFGLLARETHPLPAGELADGLSGLVVTADERTRARRTLLCLLADETDPWRAGQLARMLTQLEPSAKDLAEIRQALLDVLGTIANLSRAWMVPLMLIRLEPSSHDLAKARHALLNVLGTIDPLEAAIVPLVLTRLESSVEDLAQARQALLSLFADETDPWQAGMFANALTRLEPSATELAHAWHALLNLLANTTYFLRAGKLADPLTLLAVSGEELADTLTRLAPSGDDLAQARRALVSLLARVTDPSRARELADVLTRLAPSAEDLAEARPVLLSLLASTANPLQARKLADAAAGLLSPTVADLADSDTWPFPPPRALLAAARQNSGLPAWLAALPQLSVR